MIIYKNYFVYVYIQKRVACDHLSPIPGNDGIIGTKSRGLFFGIDMYHMAAKFLDKSI